MFQVVELHRTVQSLFDEEEALLNLHMNVIQVVFFMLLSKALDYDFVLIFTLSRQPTSKIF